MFATLASGAPPVTRSELEGTPQTRRELEAAPANVVVVDVATSATNGFSISWRGRLVHRVAAGAPGTELDGGTLVLGLCGGLGWGPIAHQPESWPVCEECDEIAIKGNA